ncbi:hypothetical protein DXG01_011276 [Tephrocybe rancida]|nr:hypothetical protein DXG01_011276 [Tephrocybe rancida]
MSPEERALLQRFGVVTFQTLPNIAVYSLFQGVLCALYYLSAILLVKNGLASMTKRIMLGLSILNVLLIFVPWAAIVAQFARMTIQVLITSAGTIDLDLFDSVNAGAFVPSLLVDWSWWLLRWVMIVPCALLVGSAGISVAAFVFEAVVLGVSFTDSTSTAVSIFAAMVSALFHTGVAAYTPIVILLVSKQKTVAETFHMTEELRGQGLLDVEITSKRRSAPLQGEMS